MDAVDGIRVGGRERAGPDYGAARSEQFDVELGAENSSTAACGRVGASGIRQKEIGYGNGRRWRYRAAVSEINVTPLIDVLLVLLIIFMVIVPVTPHGLNTLIPQPPKDKTQDQPNDRTIVVQVISNGKGEPSYKINEDSLRQVGDRAEAG